MRLNRSEKTPKQIADELCYESGQQRGRPKLKVQLERLLDVKTLSMALRFGVD